ncbi:MAG TPA: hypothetical protein VK989_08305 [Polyangia bacterium]|jgi:hypothetical protein|nr:hypothetical protein [Polyangia bacterium]
MASMEVEREEPNAATPSTEAAEAKAVIDETALEVRAFVEAHPIGAVATALGVGYVLGGGLFTRLTSKLVGLGLRLGVQFAVVPMLERELAGLAGNLGKTTTTVDDDSAETSTAH